MKIKTITRILPLIALVTMFLASCEKTQSYSELLREEEKAVNLFLANQKVCLEIPADSISFETGENAPYYKMDEDGYLYMQVIKKGDYQNKIKKGDLVYFRFTRTNIKDWMFYGVEYSEGNSDTFVGDYGNTSFVFGNTYLSSTTQFGTGIQTPLEYLGYNSEVNLVLKSYNGFTSDQTQCIPWLVNIRYFKPEY